MPKVRPATPINDDLWRDNYLRAKANAEATRILESLSLQEALFTQLLVVSVLADMGNLPSYKVADFIRSARRELDYE